MRTGIWTSVSPTWTETPQWLALIGAGVARKHSEEDTRDAARRTGADWLLALALAARATFYVEHHTYPNWPRQGPQSSLIWRHCSCCGTFAPICGAVC